MSRTTLFIARRVFGDIVDRLRAHFDVRTHDGPNRRCRNTELAAAMQGCAGVFITGSEAIDADAAGRLPVS